MTKASDNEFPSLLIKEGTAPSSPSAGDQRVYIDSSDHKLKRKNSGGTVTVIEGLPDQGNASYLDFTVGSAPATPSSGLLRLYALTGKHMYQKDDAGSATALDGAGGGVATDTIWDAKGDLAVGTGADTASKLTVGSDGQVPVADSTQSTGIQWRNGLPVQRPLIVLPPGVDLQSTSIAAPNASDALLAVINIPAPMLVDKLGFLVTTAGSGTCQWGLFDISTSASSATKLAGGSGALNSTGYQTIAASGAPVTVYPGGYIIVVLFPSTNRPQLRRTAWAGSLVIPIGKYKASASWSDTPDFTSGWTSDSVVMNCVLHGRVDASTAW